MTFRSALRRLGDASPLAPAGGYVGAAILANVGITLLPEQPVVVVLALLLLLVAGVLLFIVVTWYRDDDWLAAGFLLAVTVMLGAWIADAVAEAVSQGSIAAVVFAAPGAMLAFVVRSVVSVPVAGGIITLARWVTRRRRRADRPGRTPLA